MDVAPVRYAQTEDGVNVAYQVVEGDAPTDADILVVPGFVSHIDHQWNSAGYREAMERMTRFARVVVLDRRGVGLSDPVPAESPPTVEQRIDDFRAVMDAVGLERCVLFAMSESTPVGLMFAATHPDRLEALVLFGAMARTTADDDYPFPAPEEALLEASAELIAPHWGEGVSIEAFVPSQADDPELREWYAGIERLGGSPGTIAAMYQMTLRTDVRHVLPSIHVPTLLVHEKGDRVVNVRSSRWLAERIDGARLIELPGDDHSFFHSKAKDVVDAVEEFVTGRPPPAEVDRVLATVLFTDIVGSTERAAEAGDAEWTRVLDRHDREAREHVERFGGTWVKATGDGILATFDRPSRAVECAVALRAALAGGELTIRAGLHTGEVELRGDDVGGIAVHAASRVMGHAPDACLFVSRTVVDLTAGSGLEFADRGTHELKGVPGEWQLFEVVG